MNHGLQDTINDYWTDRAPSYDAYQQRPERRDLDVEAWGRVWSGALPAAPADVLDVGTGSGHVACLLAALGHRVTGIDLADGMLEIARAHAATMTGPPRILAGDAVAPDFPQASYDAVVGRYVMWTLRDPAAAVANWVRLLRPSGVVAMVDSTWFTDGLGSLYGDRPDAALPLADAQSIDATADVLRRAGLLDVTVTPLEEVFELDRSHGVAPGHDVQLQFLVTGRRGRRPGDRAW
ncbi:class I SAM-dependent methyltransferase [Nocardioides sp. YIM 152315]|uniref:class I SAM-dependent methyltransferase n=1 Tax=Nocardioides sp. YIM 152315 TaxID=3031760 RepID=UPI0023DC36D2|nr:class I SAM-dependent methyltransferase [Nocardioides sp. YIM 152315]MDF1601985.1 class I SAM-dependent methyltransferase [Nocardioides sp. YIM 152315]